MLHYKLFTTRTETIEVNNFYLNIHIQKDRHIAKKK